MPGLHKHGFVLALEPSWLSAPDVERTRLGFAFISIAVVTVKTYDAQAEGRHAEMHLRACKPIMLCSALFCNLQYAGKVCG